MNEKGDDREPSDPASGGAVGGEKSGETRGETTGLRILLVEDDPQALAVTMEAVTALGHFAAGASSAEVARARFFDGAFDVLITDLGLPALSGDDMVAAIRREARAPLEVIYATGQARPSGSAANWLQKPYRLEDLEAALALAAHRLQQTRSQNNRCPGHCEVA